MIHELIFKNRRYGFASLWFLSSSFDGLSFHFVHVWIGLLVDAVGAAVAAIFVFPEKNFPLGSSRYILYTL